MIHNRVYWATLCASDWELEWVVLIVARSERTARGLALRYFLNHPECSDCLPEDVVCGLKCRLERYKTGKPVKTSQPTGIYETIPEWRELGFDGDEFNHWIIAEREENLRLFDELGADENPELTANNPLIRDKGPIE